MTRERVLKLPVLEIFGPTFQGEAVQSVRKPCLSALQVATTTATGAILPLHGMVLKNQLAWQLTRSLLPWINWELRLCHPIWGKSCYPSSQHGWTRQKAQGTWCHPCCRDSRFSLAKLVKRHRPGHPQSQTSFIQDGSQLLRPWTLSFPNLIQTRSPLKSLSLMMQI